MLVLSRPIALDKMFFVVFFLSQCIFDISLQKQCLGKHNLCSNGGIRKKYLSG